FCSDVILAAPPGFEGTTGIIHPDDIIMVRQKILHNVDHINHIEFRIITSYGEVKNISGENVRIEKSDEDTAKTEADILRAAGEEKERKDELESLLLMREVYERSERYTGTGIWWYNTQTN